VVQDQILHHVGDNMRKTIALLLFLIITLNLINVKASAEVKYEVIKRNPDLVITGCNETYVYWEFNYRKFDPPVPVRYPGYNKTIYIDKIPGDYDSEKIFIYAMLAAKHALKYSNWHHYHASLAEVRKEFYPIKEKLFAEKGNLGIGTLGIMDNYVPIVIVVTMYKITDEKVNTVLEYIRPFVKKYNAIVFFIEDYFPDSIYEKQSEALDKFYVKKLPNGSIRWEDGFMEYLKLVKEYYNINIYITGWGYSPGIADLPIPKNATFNEEFVRKAISILRKYAGCEVPLVANFRKAFNITPLGPLYENNVSPIISENVNPKNPSDTLYGSKPESPSLLYLITLFAIIPIVILLPIILILRKVNNKKKKKF
jgi:hypothetical protein